MNDRFKFKALFEHIATGEIIWLFTQPNHIVVTEGYLQKSDWLQCTGLKDKNGVLIYEGDVVKQNTYPFYGDEELKELNYLGAVFFWLEESCYYIDLHVVSDRVRGAAYGRALFEYDCKNIEIIGNKFENPELRELTNEQRN